MKCTVCDKKAVGSYTIDLDVKGLAFCKKHKSIVGAAMTWLIIGVPELAEKTLEDARKNNRTKGKAKSKIKRVGKADKLVQQPAHKSRFVKTRVSKKAKGN